MTVFLIVAVIVLMISNVMLWALVMGLHLMISQAMFVGRENKETK